MTTTEKAALHEWRAAMAVYRDVQAEVLAELEELTAMTALTPEDREKAEASEMSAEEMLVCLVVSVAEKPIIDKGIRLYRRYYNCEGRLYAANRHREIYIGHGIAYDELQK